MQCGSLEARAAGYQRTAGCAWTWKDAGSLERRGAVSVYSMLRAAGMRLSRTVWVSVRSVPGTEWFTQRSKGKIPRHQPSRQRSGDRVYHQPGADYEGSAVLMKEHNVNAIRTSHYPNAPQFYQSVRCDGILMLSTRRTMRATEPSMRYMESDGLGGEGHPRTLESDHRGQSGLYRVYGRPYTALCGAG